MDFSRIIKRDHTYAMKWQKYQGRDILPMWVADTEFESPVEIAEALKARCDHGVFGYHLPQQYAPANEAVARWLEKQHQWTIEDSWLLWTPGVVPAFNVACRAYCQPGDKVIVQTPNYPPLLAAPALHGLERVDIPTVKQNERWMLDIDALERAAQDPSCKLFIVCNPMNPVGSVFTETELADIARICEENDVILVSDEIHCDLILDSAAKHIPAGKIARLKDRCITLMAASKTFNVAGLGTSFAVIENPKLRTQFSNAAAGLIPWVNIMGLVATETAFTRCDDWYSALIDYLRDNRDYLCRTINQLPGLSMLKPQATYLAWVDGTELGVDSPQRWCEERGVGPSPGADFGESQFVRINFGCPRYYLEETVRRLKA